MFGLISGLHLDPNVFKGADRTFWAIAAANVVVPMFFGGLAGYWIATRFPGELLPGVSRLEFMAAIGICVSMKALPVLSAILGELGLLGDRIGHVALGVAGVNDVVLWFALSVVLADAAAGHEGVALGLSPAWLLLAAPIYFLVAVWILRPTLGVLIAHRMRGDQISNRAAVLVGAASIASALVTEVIGLHYILGAFLIGAILPDRLHKPIVERLQVMTVAILMPFFFALTGMRTMIDFSSPAIFEIFVGVAAVGVIGIISGTVLAATLSGERLSFGFGLGALLQAKGLTELIVLTVLLDARIVSPRVFAALVLMALLSTALAMPLARFALAQARRGGLVMQPLTEGQQV